MSLNPYDWPNNGYLRGSQLDAMPVSDQRPKKTRESFSSHSRSEITIKMTSHSFMVLAVLWAIVIIWPRGSTANLIEGQSVELVLNGAAALVNIHEPQLKLHSVSEFYSLEPLEAVKKNMQEILRYAQQLGEPIMVPLNEAREHCPLLGGREIQQDPTIGPHPAYLPNPSQSMSPIEIYTKKNGNSSSCGYTISGRVLSSMEQTFPSYHYNQQANSWLNFKQLLSPHCPDGSYGRGDISQNYQSLVFPHRRSYNLILCGELCRNSFEQSKINCSAPMDQDWGELGCGMEGCRTYSYNPQTSECRLSPDHKPSMNEDWYGPSGEKGGITGIWVKVRCQSAILLPDVRLRAPLSRANKQFPLWSARATCVFDPLLYPTYRVYARCSTAESAIKILLAPTMAKIEDLSNKLKKKLDNGNLRMKRSSPLSKGLGAAGPQVLSFLSHHMLQIAPKFAHIPAAGPVLGLLLGLAGSLLPLISHIAYQSQSDDNYPVNSGTFIMQKRSSLSKYSQNWTQDHDILKLDYQSTIKYGVSLTSWIHSVVEQARVVEKSVLEILSDPRPRHRKIKKQLQKFDELNFVTFFSSPHFLRRQFYWSAPIKAGNPITNQALLSLNSDLPLVEGWRSSVSLSATTGLGPVSYMCTQNFNEQNPIPPDCLDPNRLGTPMESVLPASTKYLILKVLGKNKLIQILCGGNFVPATFATKGTFLAIVGRNCDAFSEGGLLIRAEQGDLALGYKVLINSGPKLINHSIPLAKGIRNQIINYTAVGAYPSIFLACWMMILTITLCYCQCCNSNIANKQSDKFSSGDHPITMPNTYTRPADPADPGPGTERAPDPPPLPLWRQHPEFKQFKSSRTSAALL